jgi:hypothetical protein
VEVVFDVAGRLFPLPEPQATILAEELLRKAAGAFGETYGMAGARGVAGEIERRLTYETPEPIPLEGEAAEAVFYMLNIGTDVNDPAQAELAALYRALVAFRS